MKINTLAKTSVIALAMLVNSIPVYATNIITANSINNIDRKELSIISSKNGETISKINSLNDAFKISFTDNDYITTKFAKVKNGKDNTNFVPVYTMPVDNSTQIGSIPVDSTVVIGKEENGFAQILFAEKIGYIKKEHLIDSVVEEHKPTIEQTNNGQVNQNTLSAPTAKFAQNTSGSTLNLRQQNSISSTIVDAIPNGAYVDLLGIDNGWLKVNYNGKVGFISSQFVTLTNEKQKVQVQNQNKGNGQAVVDFAKTHLGKPYIYGSTNLNVGTDCSGFTYAVFKNFGVNLNRVSKDQFLNGVSVEKQNLQPGDLVFFNTGGNSPISHVGIYIGNNEYIHSTDSKNRGVIISNINSDYSSKTYYGARRVI